MTQSRFPQCWLLLAVLSCLAAPSLAQRGGKPGWQIPHRGYLSYLRQQRSEPRNMFSGGRYLTGFSINNPAVLLQGELDPSQRYLSEDPGSLWEVAMHTAFDLRSIGKKAEIDHTYAFLQGFGAVRIHGTAVAVDDSGRQRLELQIERVPLPEDRYPAKVLAHLNSSHKASLTGTLKIERHYRADVGRINSFTSNLTLQIDGTPARLREEWIFKAAKPCRYPGFEQRVAEAIRNGGEYLSAQVANLTNQHLKAGPDSLGRTVGTGQLALCLLTMVKAEISRTDKILLAGFDELRRREINDTYSLAIAIMAIEALYAPYDERQQLIEGRIKAPQLRQPSPADLTLLKAWTARLLTHTDANIKDLAYTRRHYYQPGIKFYDNSNTQYTTLGLYSAHLCGVRISPTIWHTLANHWLSDQLPDGDAIALSLVSHTEYAKMRTKAARSKPDPKRVRRTNARGPKVEPAGWPYTTYKLDQTEHFMPLTISMTVAGITGLTICEAALRSQLPAVKEKPKKKSRKKRRTKRKERSKQPNDKAVFQKLASARDRGYAWMLDNFSLRCNKHRLGYGYHFYFLYGVERACELGQIALIGDRDWYFEGSTMVLGMLDANLLSLPAADLYSTCFAILFLKQAAPPLPAITGRRRRR